MNHLILQGDVLTRLRELPDESVQCVVTSPPYWGLRNYGVAGMIGLEPTLQEHLAKLVEVFREVRRVLRGDGTVWLNYGDAYSGGAKAKRKERPETEANRARAESRGYDVGSWGASARSAEGFDRFSADSGLAPKQRLLMPARVALALQDDGWWVRSEIVWAKGVSFCESYSGSCMPSSVTDRPTDSHETLYLLTKSPRYFYDADAVREQGDYPAGTQAAKGSATRRGEEGVNARPTEYATYSGTRNLRTVWTIGTQAMKEAHFATFPEALVEPCLKAGTSAHGACGSCGAPWRRSVEKGESAYARLRREGKASDWKDMQEVAQGQGKALKNGAESVGGTRLGNGTVPSLSAATRETTGWESTCACGTASPIVPCVVLDPFLGSGTVSVVSARLGCSSVGIELNWEYARMAELRLGRERLALAVEKQLGRGAGRRWVLAGQSDLTKSEVDRRLRAAGIPGRRVRRIWEQVTT